jgi:nucleoside phosphorylase/CheY-like chemotaxis protein
MKISILLVDDNAEKIGLIEEHIDLISKELAIQCSVDAAQDIVSAKRLLRDVDYDLAIVDVQVPVRAGKAPDKMGGIALVQELDESDLLRKPAYILAVTAYINEIPEAYVGLLDRYFSLVEFSRESTSWRVKLSKAFGDIVKSLAQQRRGAESSPGEAGLAIVCALDSPELRSVLDLPIDWSILDDRSDCIDIYEGRIESRSGRHRIVAAAALEPGMAASAALCARVIAEFHPRYLAMTGIAGGMKAATKLGDVIAADVVWDYTSGKIVQKRRRQDFLPEPRTIDLDATVKGQLRRLAETPGVLSRIRDQFPGSKPDHALDVVFGPMFTGSAVIANSQFAASLGDMHRKIKGIDMEAYSVACAAKYAAHAAPIPIILKSVSDFADAEKNDDFHAYASYTSAMVLFEWARRFL